MTLFFIILWLIFWLATGVYIGRLQYRSRKLLFVSLALQRNSWSQIWWSPKDGSAEKTIVYFLLPRTAFSANWFSRDLVIGRHELGPSHHPPNKQELPRPRVYSPDGLQQELKLNCLKGSAACLQGVRKISTLNVKISIYPDSETNRVSKMKGKI